MAMTSHEISPVARSTARVAFVFAAQGTAWAGMGRDLMAADITFRHATAACDRAIQRHFDWSLCRELEAEPGGSRLHLDHEMVQPALTSLQIALTETLAGRGIRPDAVASLSMGEAAAAYCAGAIDLDGAIDIACSTARLADTRLRPGLMAFVHMSWHEAETLISEFRDRVDLAVELGSKLTIIAGEETAVRRALSIASASAIPCGLLPLAQAYHTTDVGCLADGFKKRLSRLRSRPPTLPLYTSISGSMLEPVELTADHWWQICSRPARFYTLALAMIRDGYRQFVEIGPHPMLSGAIHEAAAAQDKTSTVHMVMERGIGAIDHLAETVRALSCSVGAPP